MAEVYKINFGKVDTSKVKKDFETNVQYFKKNCPSWTERECRVGAAQMTHSSLHGVAGKIFFRKQTKERVR